MVTYRLDEGYRRMAEEMAPSDMSVYALPPHVENELGDAIINHISIDDRRITISFARGGIRSFVMDAEAREFYGLSAHE